MKTDIEIAQEANNAAQSSEVAANNYGIGEDESGAYMENIRQNFQMN